MPVAISEQDLEALLLFDVYHTRNLVDRYPDDPLALGKGLNYHTGAPESPDDLKRPGANTLRGEKLQRAAFFMPANLATLHLRRPCEECLACTAGDLERCETGPTLKYVARDEWSEVDAANVADLENRIQAVFLRWEAAHLLERRAPITFSGSVEGDKQWTALPGQDTWVAYFLPAGLERARTFCESPDAPSWIRTAIHDNRRSGLWAMSPKQRANAPQWQQKEFIAEGGYVLESLADRRSEDEIATRCRACERWHSPKDGCAADMLVPAKGEQPSALRRFLNALRLRKKGR